MKIANLPDNEGERIIALERYGIMDTPPDAVFDLSLIHISEPTRPY